MTKREFGQNRKNEYKKLDYAKKRIKDHVGRFTKLYEQIKSNNIDKDFLNDVAEKDKIFEDIDYMIYY